MAACHDSRYLRNGSGVVFIGWLFGGFIQGLKDAEKLYEVKTVCAVGMSTAGVQSLESLRKRNSINNIPLFYLQGGFFMERLRFKYKLPLLFLKNTLGRSLLNKKNPTDADKQSIEMFFRGADYFNEENLSEVISFLKN